MKYFDIVHIGEGIDPDLAKRLGFSGIFSFGNDVELSPKPVADGKKRIVCSKDAGTLMNALREQSVIGISFEDNEIIAKVIAAAKDAEKPIVVDLFGMFAGSAGERYRNTARIRGLLKAVASARAQPALISGARNPNYLLSTSQLLELAKFLGEREEKAKSSISIIGENIDS